MSKFRSNCLLLLCAMIWGSAFVAQSSGMDHIGPWTFNALRSLIGGATLLILMPLLDKVRNVKKQEAEADKKTLLIGGVACGIALCAASIFQQMGIQYTTVGKAGFLTALYTIVVPILGTLIGKKTRPLVWLCVVISLVGFYFLSMAESLTLSYGDGLVLVSALLFSVHILIIDHFSPLIDGVRMSCIQFFTAGIISLVPMFLFESPDMHSIMAAAVPILYAGVLSSGAGYTLQIVGQKGADPAVASLILSLESVFSAIFGFLLLHQVLSFKELSGCALIFLAIILSQLPEKKKA
ncbi:MAG: DMT family transporter [Bulleidia sp.]